MKNSFQIEWKTNRYFLNHPLIIVLFTAENFVSYPLNSINLMLVDYRCKDNALLSFDKNLH